MSLHDVLGQEIDRLQRNAAGVERARIVRLIADLPLSPCKCDESCTLGGHHDERCLFDAEVTFRVRCLQAITTPAPTPSRSAEASRRVSAGPPVAEAAFNRASPKPATG